MSNHYKPTLPDSKRLATANMPACSKAPHYDSAIMSAFEHQRLLACDFAHNSDFEWLLAQEFSVFTIKRQRGQWQLQVKHYIGVIVMPSGITLEILPKAIGTHKHSAAAYKSPHDEIAQTRQWVQLMLSDLAQSRQQNNRKGINNSKSPHIKSLGQLSQHLTPLPAQTLPLSQWLVKRFLQLLTQYQPSKSYQSQTDNLSALQGKLLVKEQLTRNSHQPHKFACEVSHLSPEMLFNQMIKSALLLIEPLTNTNQASISKLTLKLIPWRQITAFSTYQRQNLPSLYSLACRQLSMQPMTHQQRRGARLLLDLAYWLLQMQQSSMPTGNVLGVRAVRGQQSSQWRLCLLINMQQAFEQWASLRVAQMFEQYNHYQAYYQTPQVWLRDQSGQSCLTIRPDLLIYQTVNNSSNNKANTNNSNHDPDSDSIPSNKATHCSHVIDIKWKSLTHPRDISASDAYQLTSYAQAYQAPQVWLVYPVTDRTTQPVALTQPIQQPNHSPPTLWLMPFNVTTGLLNHCFSL